MKKTLVVLVAVISVSLSAQAQQNVPNKKMQKAIKNLNSICKKDFATAGCSDVRGHERIQCLRGYKHEHEKFELSSKCKKAFENFNKVRKSVMENASNEKTKHKKGTSYQSRD